MRNSADQTHRILLLFYSAVSLSSSTLWDIPAGRGRTISSGGTARSAVIILGAQKRERRSCGISFSSHRFRDIPAGRGRTISSGGTARSAVIIPRAPRACKVTPSHNRKSPGTSLSFSYIHLKLCKFQRIDLYARAHCRCKSDALQVLSLNCCRSRLVDCIDKRLEVVR